MKIPERNLTEMYAMDCHNNYVNLKIEFCVKTELYCTFIRGVILSHPAAPEPLC